MPEETSQWTILQEAWDRGDFTRVRDALDRMSSDEMEQMRAELGGPLVARLLQVRRRRRGPKKGRVVIINGIMGAHLYSIDRSGEVDHVWINLGRIFFGQMARLELTLDGEQVKKKFRIEARRLHKTYLPLALELESNWEVLHFPFDWRLDMDLEATRLAARISSWAGDDPVHLVTHSMGGVLSRRFIQKFPAVWQGMADPDGLRRGGRLLMMGTPNRGSFVISAMLTGKEKLVKILSFIDFGESKRRFLRNASSFPGGYQMLPSPVVDLQDDHLELFKKVTWGRYRVIERHLPMAKRFQTELDTVLSPERLVYVAGYGVKTQQRIEVRKPGRFRYEITRDGDGRVAHSLGLLEGVETQWVQEKHGDLPLNQSVIDGMDDLLELGRTPFLETTRPALRGFEEAEWVDDEELVVLSEEEQKAAKALGTRLRAARSRGRSTIQVTRNLRYAEDTMFDHYLASSTPAAYREAAADTPRRERRKPHLEVEVVWGDIRKVRGDIYCVGHYEGVLPQRAEYALDTVVSSSRKGAEMVLRTHTQRGVLRGRLGDVDLYPWAKKYSPPRTVAVAGMGRPGQFGEASLRKLGQHLAWKVASLPRTETICSILIGSGEGGLSTYQATRGLIQGMVDALEAGLESAVRQLHFVELIRDKAEEIQEVLKELSQSEERVELRLAPKVRASRGGSLSDEHSLALALAALARSRTSLAPGPGRASSTVLEQLPVDSVMRRSVRETLLKVAENPPEGNAEPEEGKPGPKETKRTRATLEQIASRIRVQLETQQEGPTEPARMSFWRSDGATHVSALTTTAVIPERISRVAPSLLDELRGKLQDPQDEDVARFGSLLNRLAVPRDFRSVLEGAASLVFEVDRPMSTLNWELMTVGPQDSSARDCLAKRYPLARQLRTEYSPPPSGERPSAGGLRALVIGDPGDPKRGEHLPGARDEAREVGRLLTGFGVDVTLRLGAPVHGRGPVSGVPPASMLEVLELLQTQRFDILHYAGHGDFRDDQGLRSGWLFHDGMLSAPELGTIDSPPRLIVANACLSARTSTRIRGGERVSPEFGDAGLLPSLADEFLRRGVRDYIGTAWEINDEGAVLFATCFYESLGLGGSRATCSLGDALLAAREKLFMANDRYGALWASYQHYGDPTLLL